MPNSARIPILAPIHATQICPLGLKERWELRALPFGCNVSTLTFLSIVVAVVGMVALIGIGLVVFWFVRSVRRRWKESDYERLDDGQSAWWRFIDFPVLGSLAGLFFGQSDGQGQISTQNAGEEGQDQNDRETRPLLEGM